MFKKLNQAGTSVVEVILLIVILAMIGGTGYYVYRASNKSVDNLNTANSGSESPVVLKKKTAKKPQTAQAQKFLTIKEWGVKVKLGSADPSLVTYKLSGPGSDNEGAYNDSAILSLNSSVTSDAKCQALGLAIDQRAQKPSENDTAKSLGKYFYDVTGNPASCGDSKLDAIRQQYTGNNPASWEYSPI